MGHPKRASTALIVARTWALIGSSRAVRAGKTRSRASNWAMRLALTLNRSGQKNPGCGGCWATARCIVDCASAATWLARAMAWSALEGPDREVRGTGSGDVRAAPEKAEPRPKGRSTAARLAG